MACECNFNAAIPTACVFELVSMVRNQTLVSNRGRALQVCGTVLGQVGAMMEGMPSVPVFGDAEAPATLEACCDAAVAQMPIDEPRLYGMNPLLKTILTKLVMLVIAEVLN